MTSKKWFLALVIIVCYWLWVCIGYVSEEKMSNPDKRGQPSDGTRLKKSWEEAKKLSIGRDNERVHRLPDVIAIGIQKCGTGALATFLSFHPYMRVLATEGKFFGNSKRKKGLEYYRNMMPPALEHELVMEKTPSYIHANPPNLPQVIHQMMPKVKIIVILCDPVQRALSSFAMYQELHRATPESFEDFVKRTIENKSKSEEDILMRGIYHMQIRRWMEEFDDSLFIMDGEEFIENPGKVIEDVQKFLNIPVLLRRDDFVRDKTSGLFCILPWRENSQKDSKSTGRMQCLGENKGRTRSSEPMYTMTNKAKAELKRFYCPHNEKLFKILNRSFDW